MKRPIKKPLGGERRRCGRKCEEQRSDGAIARRRRQRQRVRVLGGGEPPPDDILHQIVLHTRLQRPNSFSSAGGFRSPTETSACSEEEQFSDAFKENTFFLLLNLKKKSQNQPLLLRPTSCSLDSSFKEIKDQHGGADRGAADRVTGPLTASCQAGGGVALPSPCDGSHLQC